MGDLQNKQISQTYDALIQTGTDEPIDGTLRPLQDGSGQTLPVEVSTTGVNFTGTVAGIDTGVQSVVAGTNVTVDNTDPANPIVSAAGGGGGGTSTNQYMDPKRPANLNGWNANEYWFTSRPIIGGLNWQLLNDQSPGSIQMHFVYPEPGQAISEISIPIRNIGVNTTYEFGIYDLYPSGSPRNRLVSENVPVNTANNVSGSQYVKHTLTTPFVPTDGVYYFAFRCVDSNSPNEYDQVLAVLSRNEVTSNIINTDITGGSVQNLYQAGVFQTNVGGPLPATFDENQSFFEREEQLILLFR